MNEKYDNEIKTTAGKSLRAKALRTSALLLLLAVTDLTQAAKPQPPTDEIRVRITTERDGDVTRFFVENLERTEITMTFNLGLGNLRSTTALPLTASFAPQHKTEAFHLSPVNPNEPWDYTFTNYYNLGSCTAVHDDTYLYNLPYAAGSTYRVSQGYDGKFSHTGAGKYSTDWRMPEGTQVHAARGGMVVKVKDGSNRGGGSIEYDCYNNYVLIRHSDGTIGQYCHLSKGGMKVHEGDVVKDGDVIALSGNTGFSSGPHLHFSVYKSRDGRAHESIPVKFRTADAVAVTLQAGRSYTAPRPNIQEISRAPQANPIGG